MKPKTEHPHAHPAKEEVRHFILDFMTICNNHTYNSSRKKIEIGRLMKNLALEDERIFGDLVYLAIHEEHPSDITEEASIHKPRGRKRGNDIIDEVV